jgi:hypothetical protein
MVKIKGYRFECEVCQVRTSIQVFYNKSGEMKYGRARHYVGRVNNKPKFEYHQQSLKYIRQSIGPVIGQVNLSDLGSVSQNNSKSNTTLLPAELLYMGSIPIPSSNLSIKVKFMLNIFPPFHQCISLF